MRKIFVITILGFAILSHAQSNYPKNSKEKKNNVKNVQSESIHEYQQPYKNISSTKLYSDNLVILYKSAPPKPPGISEEKYNVFPSEEIDGC